MTRLIDRRNLAACCGLALLLAVPAVALGASRGQPRRLAVRVVARGSVTGTITAMSGSSFTVQTAGRPVGVVNALTAAANKVTRQDYPYVYGGGHAQAGIASVGIKGPGYTGHTIGYDCSGSVAAVLAAAGLWPAGTGVPSDAGIIAQLLSGRFIASWAAAGPVGVTLYDNPGVHIFMNIDGHFFGTSDGGGGANSRGGAGWLDDGAPDAFSTTYKRYHLLPSVLRSSTSAAYGITFQVPQDGGLIAGSQVGDKVNVSYEQTSSGTVVATALTYPGEVTARGTVESIADDASSFTLLTPAGSSLTFNTAGVTNLLDSLAIGDTVEVTYTKSSSGPVARAVTVTATPPSASVPATNGSGSGSGTGSGAGGSASGYGDGWPQ